MTQHGASRSPQAQTGHSESAGLVKGPNSDAFALAT
jgi:hypothetical protein